jgi:hypothetical protein
LRTVEIRSYDGNTVLVPNKDVLQNPIVNYTRTPYRRTELVVGVAYDTDLERARQVLLGACGTVKEVREQPPPEAWVFEFGDSSINIALRYWHPADIASVWRVRSAVAIAVKRALDEAGMTIPFPQRTLWFGPGNTVLRTESGGRRSAMTLVEVLWYVALTPPLVLLVRILFRFLDESAEYELELKRLRDLGLRDLDGKPVQRWLRQIRYSPHAVRQYRSLRHR